MWEWRRSRVIVLASAVVASVMAMPACSRSTATSTGPDGVEWRLIEVEGMPVSFPADQRQPGLSIDAADGKATGFAGCNGFFTTCRLEGASLAFGPIAATRRSCAEGEAVETKLLDALARTNGWRTSSGELLLLAGDEVVARFAPAGDNSPAVIDQASTEAPAITGEAWRWVRTLYSNDTAVSPARPEDYTLRFLDDGRVDVKADCNLKAGTYTADDNRLSIAIASSTMAACEPGSLEDEFIRNLAAAESFLFQDGDLVLVLRLDTGTMRLTRSR